MPMKVGDVSLTAQQEKTLRSIYQAESRRWLTPPSFEAWLAEQLAAGMILPHTPEHDAFIAHQMSH